MTRDEKIIRLLREITKDRHCFVAKVLDNFPDEQFIEVEDADGTNYPDVRKKASLNNEQSGLLITPAIDSYVIVSRIDSSDELFVEMVSEVASCKMIASNDIALSSQEGTINIVAEQGVVIDGAAGKVSIGNNAASLLGLMQDLVGVIKKLKTSNGGTFPTAEAEFKPVMDKFEKLLSDE